MLKLQNVNRRISQQIKHIFGSNLAEFVANQKPYLLENYINGHWTDPLNPKDKSVVLNPLTSKASFEVGKLTYNTIQEIKSDLSKCPKSGLFNPLKNPQMYRKWGDIKIGRAHV